MHPLVRKHLLNDKRTVSGMPEKSGYHEKNRLLDSNVNYYTDSTYNHYPPESNPKISDRYIDFLKCEHCSKSGDAQSLSFLTPSHLLFMSASTAIDLLIRVFCEPGLDKVCISSPTFPLYAYCSLYSNAPLVDVPLIGENYDRLDVEKILAESPKLIFIPSPNNPIGCVPNYQDILYLLDNTASIVVVDEAYIEYSDHPSLISHIAQYPNLIILRSFSKVWGLAGIRCGTILGNPSAIYALNKCLTPYHFPMHTQQILEKALDQFQIVFDIKAVAKRDSAKLREGLENLSMTVKTYPSETNFILVEFDDPQRVFHELLKAGFLVKNTSAAVPNTLRISLGTTEDNEHLIAALKTIDLSTLVQELSTHGAR